MRKCDAANGSADARFNDSTDEPASPSQAKPFSSRDRGENPPTVFLLVWTGTADQAMEVVRYHYADYKIVLLSHRKLREGGWKGQVRALRDLRGEALVFFFQSLGPARTAPVGVVRAIASLPRNRLRGEQRAPPAFSPIRLAALVPQNGFCSTRRWHDVRAELDSSPVGVLGQAETHEPSSSGKF